MRYLNWDVLIFQQGSGIPIQEFRTASFAIQDGNALMPTLVTYVPSLPDHAPFAVSIHAWTKPDFTAALQKHHLDLGGDLSGFTPAWGVRILVNGVCLSSVTFTSKATWPQVINSTDHFDPELGVQALTFPAFDRSVLSRREWDIGADEGRVKILLTEGLRSVAANGRVKFGPFSNVASFTFHPAPMHYLQKCNIAWPNHAMFDKPVLPSQSAAMPAQHHGKFDCMEDHRHYVHAFSSSVQAGQPEIGSDPPRYAPISTGTSHMQPFQQYPSVRASRKFSLMGGSNAISPENIYGGSFSLDGAGDETIPKSKHRGQLPVIRLPSDQLDRIIAAIGRNTVRKPSGDKSKWTSSDESCETLQAWSGATAGSEGSQWISGEDANRARNSSDVTMFSVETGLPIFPRGVKQSEGIQDQARKIKESTRTGSQGHTAVAAIPVTIVSPTPLRGGARSDKLALGGETLRCDSPLSGWGASDTTFRAPSSLSQKADHRGQEQDNSGIVL